MNPASIAVTLAAFSALLAGLYNPSAALACSCAERSPEQHVRSTPVIFEGRVVEVRRSRQPATGIENVTATMQVATRWKGDVASQVEVHSHTASSACGYSQFPVEQTLLVLAYPRREGSGFSTNMCAMAPTFGNTRMGLLRTLARIRGEQGLLETEIAQAPQTVLPVIRLARHLEQWHDLPAAARTYVHAGTIVPNFQLALAGEGRMLFQLGLYREAIAPLTRASGLPQPPDPETTRLLGQARFFAGDRNAVQTMDFRNLEARDLDLRGYDLAGRDFSDARLHRVRLDDARLMNARFARARMTGTSFAGADLSGADLRQMHGGKDFSRTRLDNADLTGAALYGAVLQGASLRNVSGVDVNLGGTTANGAVFAAAQLHLALMHNADFTGADFSGASLIGAALTRSNLCGADLSSADLRGADLRAARYDARTRFPPRFDPTTAGMIFVESADSSLPR